CNPMLSQEYAKNVMSEFGVAMESWAPFGEGKSGMFSNQTIASIGKKYGKTNAQVILRWLIQRGVVVIPKTVRKERMIENISVFDFSLDESDMSLIAGLDSGKSLFLDHRDPEKVKFLNGLFR
ncbi:MAG: aldo/keto reductase, partial [Campylobacter hyointestinalis]